MVHICIFIGIKNFRCFFNEFFLSIIKVIDSWGKIPAGILSGNFYEFGNFDQCLQIAHITNSSINSFYPQYCLSTVTIDVSSMAVLPQIISAKNEITDRYFEVSAHKLK